MGVIKKYILIFLIGVILLLVGTYLMCIRVAFGAPPDPKYTIFGVPPQLIPSIAGLITAIAGLITAITGFILALYQIIHLRLSEKSRHEGKKKSLTDDQLE